MLSFGKEPFTRKTSGGEVSGCSVPIFVFLGPHGSVAIAKVIDLIQIPVQNETRGHLLRFELQTSFTI